MCVQREWIFKSAWRARTGSIFHSRRRRVRSSSRLNREVKKECCYEADDVRLKNVEDVHLALD